MTAMFCVDDGTCNGYTMACPPVRGNNPRALASGLSYEQVNIHGKLFYTTYISIERIACLSW